MARTQTTHARRSFAMFLTSRTISWTGNALTAVALPLMLFAQTNSATLTALLTVGEAVPYLVLGLPAGAVVDRWDARRTMVATSVIGAGLAASIPLIAVFQPPPAPLLILVATAQAAVFVFFDAASFRAIPLIAGRDAIGAATARMLTASTVVGVLGPPLGGVLFGVAGGPAVLLIDAASYAVGAAMIARVTWPPEEAAERARGTIRRDIAEGLAYIWRTPVVRWLTVIGVGNSFAGGIVAGLLVVLAVRDFGVASQGPLVGLLFASAAVGTLLAARAIGPAQRHAGVGMITAVGLAVGLAAILGLAASPAVPFAVAAVLIWQFGNSVVSLNGIIVRQSVTPQALQGRVNTTARMVAWGGQPLGAAVGGVLADTVGTRPAIAIGALGLLVSLLLAWRSGVLKTGTIEQLPASEHRSERLREADRDA